MITSYTYANISCIIVVVSMHFLEKNCDNFYIYGFAKRNKENIATFICHRMKW